MNLHALLMAWRNGAVWLSLVGRNGHSMGQHLYEITPMDAGTPPRFTGPAAWQTQQRYRPRRYEWAPYEDWRTTLFDYGWVRPLCGKRSTSQPRTYWGWTGTRTCLGCETEAQRRGTVVMDYQQLRDRTPMYLELRAEERAWEAAGRPTADEWDHR